MMKMPKLTTDSPYLVEPGKKIDLGRRKTDDRGGLTEDSAAPVLAAHRKQLETLQEVLYAGEQKAVLVVLQGMDTAGKDGAIGHIFSGVNPQGCAVASFKVPTPLEARHDFLWRVHAAVPPRGMIGIFNRSHYEDVLAPRVHKVISKKVMRERLEQINAFEASLVEDDVVILKFFLHISRDEQARRLQERIDTPDKRWKLSEADFHERAFWKEYQRAYEDLLARTSQRQAPWFVIPSDHKWYRNVAISEILVKVMGELPLRYPTPTVDYRKLKL